MDRQSDAGAIEIEVSMHRERFWEPLKLDASVDDIPLHPIVMPYEGRDVLIRQVEPYLSARLKVSEIIDVWTIGQLVRHAFNTFALLSFFALRGTNGINDSGAFSSLERNPVPANAQTTRIRERLIARTFFSSAVISAMLSVRASMCR